jgi:hypothetical protein
MKRRFSNDSPPTCAGCTLDPNVKEGIFWIFRGIRNIVSIITGYPVYRYTFSEKDLFLEMERSRLE